MTVPAGTTLNVRLTEGIEVDSAKAGAAVRAIVDDPVMIGGKVVIPRGAAAALQVVKVAQSGTMKGSDNITLKMNSIPLAGSATTSPRPTSSRRAAVKARRRHARSAVVWASAPSSAGLPAGVGRRHWRRGRRRRRRGGRPAPGQEHLKLPAETRLQFQLSAAVKVQP